MVGKAIRRWEHFWFEDVPSDLFALVRISIGAAGLIGLIGFLPIGMFWLPDGIFPIPGAGLGLRSYVIDSGFGNVAGWALFATLLTSFVCMTIGLFTAVAVPVCFLGSALQVHWNVLPLTSGHTVLVALLFCLVWAECGSAPSMDAWRRRRLTGATNPVDPVDSASVNRQPIWPLRLLRAQVALLYLSSGLFKFLGPTWRDGSAIHYTTAQNVFGRILTVHPLPTGLDWMTTVATYGTLLWEIGFAFLLWNRITRKVMLLLGVAIHLGIQGLMEVGPFTWMMLASYVAFLDPNAVARWLSGRGAAPVHSRSEVLSGSPSAARSTTSAA